MKLILCVDKNGGMMFNKRRQSQDAKVCEKIIQICEGQKLWMDEYSLKQFVDIGSQISVDNDFMSKADNDDFCFVESFVPSLEHCECLYIFNWNRKYPADLIFDVDLKKNGFKEINKEEFAGSSHDKITLKCYIRE